MIGDRLEWSDEIMVLGSSGTRPSGSWGCFGQGVGYQDLAAFSIFDLRARVILPPEEAENANGETKGSVSYLGLPPSRTFENLRQPTGTWSGGVME